MYTALISKAIFKATNRRRLANNLPPFHFSENLESAALLHSDSMLRHNFFAHENRFNPLFKNPANRIAYCSGDFHIVGENIALLPFIKNGMTYSTRIFDLINIPLPGKGLDVEEFANYVVKRWMGSPGHRDNILRYSFRYMGIGTLLTERYGNCQWVKYGLVTQTFGGYLKRKN